MITNSVIVQNKSILQGIRLGQDEVLLKIFKEYKQSIVHLLSKYGAQLEEAEDVFMMGLEAIHEKLQTSELDLDKSSFKTYFTKVCIFQWSKIKRRKKFTSTVTLDHLVVWSDMEDLESELIENDKKKLFQDKMLLLSDECRQILELFFSGESSGLEIANQLGIAEGNLRKRKYNCKERLFKLVQNDPLYKELI